MALLEGVLRIALPVDAFLYGWDPEFWRVRAQASECVTGELVDLELDPTLGWRMRRSYAKGDVSHDEHGFRTTLGQVTRPDARPVVVIGDSFAYGLGLADRSTFASRLQELGGKRFVNLGVNGFGIDQAVLYWETEGRKLNPGLVVLGYYSDDFHRNAHRIRGLPKPSFQMLANGTLVPLPVGECRDLVRGAGGLRLASLMGWSWRKFLDKTVGYPEAMLEERRALSKSLLARLRDSVAEADARLVVLLIPHCTYPHDGAYGDWVLGRTAQDCAALGIDCIDFTDMTQASDFGDNCHWSASSAEVAAQRIYDRTDGLAFR